MDVEWSCRHNSCFGVSLQAVAIQGRLHRPVVPPAVWDAQLRMASSLCNTIFHAVAVPITYQEDRTPIPPFVVMPGPPCSNCDLHRKKPSEQEGHNLAAPTPPTWTTKRNKREDRKRLSYVGGGCHDISPTLCGAGRLAGRETVVSPNPYHT